MREQADLFGEIRGDEIVKIAWEAAEKRRQAAEKMNKQMRLGGTVPVCRGYAIYEDFNEYMEQKRIQMKFKFRSGGFYHFKIKKSLEDAGWECDTAHRPTRFYPPGTESLNLGRSLI